jgi:multidrug transporter EmrE-like cation transporter
MTELTANVNWLAVIIGFVLSFLLGWLWYSPKLFGTKWAEGVGVKMGEASAMPMAPMVLQAVGTFLLSWLVGITAASNALATIILITITIMVLMAAGAQFTRKSSYAMWTEVGFVAAMVVLMIVVQGIL